MKLLNMERHPWGLAFWVILGVGLLVIFWKGASYYMQSPTDKGPVTVYGSKTCPWCVKQEEYLTKKGIPYNFEDCSTGQCPAFVEGFPTLVVNGAVMKSGYTEL